MTIKQKLLKPKTQSITSHNPNMEMLVGAVQKISEVPFQVRLSEALAMRVKIYSAKNNLSHKQIVTEALEKYLESKE